MNRFLTLALLLALGSCSKEHMNSLQDSGVLDPSSSFYQQKYKRPPTLHDIGLTMPKIYGAPEVKAAEVTGYQVLYQDGFMPEVPDMN